MVVAYPPDDALRLLPLPHQLGVQLLVEAALDGRRHRRRQEQRRVLPRPQSRLELRGLEGVIGVLLVPPIIIAAAAAAATATPDAVARIIIIAPPSPGEAG